MTLYNRESFRGSQLFLTLGEIEYLRKKYKNYSYNEILLSSDFSVKDEYVIVEYTKLPIKIHCDRLFNEGIDKSLKKIKKAIIRSIDDGDLIISYRIEKERLN